MEALEVFVACLEREVKAYESFLARLPLKLALMRKNQVGPLSALVAREEEDRKALQACESDRRVAGRALALGLDLPVDSSLRVLAAGVGGEGAGLLLGLRQRLAEVIARLQAGNETAALLAQASLDYVGFSLGLFSRALNPEEQLADMTYGGWPGGTGRAASSLLDRTA
ncbi:MAG: flagellar export chaperone FlgN [Candidatus Sericytochromatia bacterium]|nr:flagellar export chaperone FlgN [Candidatus Sericytochromatia bacterium]